MPDLRTLLSVHGLDGVPETPLTHRGFSGATLTRLQRPDGRAFVLKRMSIERDWIMQATDDRACREAAFAAADVTLPSGITTPYAGAARDCDEHVILMHDISTDMLPLGVIGDAEAIIDRIAELSAAPIPGGLMPWCGLRERLTLLTPATAAIAAQFGAPVARDITEGWRLFEKLASPAAVEIVRALFQDVAPLLHALEPLPKALLHGDLKFDNIGLAGDGRMWLIDWAMTLVAPLAVDIGWFLAINSTRMNVTLDDALVRYSHGARIEERFRSRHEATAVLCGLLLRGWRKALDADERRPAELSWWCERAEAAARFL